MTIRRPPHYGGAARAHYFSDLTKGAWMIAANIVTIEIVNWRQYVTRGDLKAVNWIRLNANMPFDHRLHSLSGEQKWGWILLLTEGARQNQDGIIDIDIDCLANLGRINKKALHELLQHLEKYELICTRVKSARTRAEDQSQSHDDVRYEHNVTLQNTTLDNTTPSNTRASRKRPPDESDHVYDLTESELDLGRKWLEMALSEMPHKANDPKWHTAAFAEEIKALGKAINYTHEQMVEVFNFIANSEFWRPNCCSPKAMLKKRSDDGLRKIDTVLTRMKNPRERLRDIKQEQEADPNRPRGDGLMSRNELEKLFGRKWNE